MIVTLNNDCIILILKYLIDIETNVLYLLHKLIHVFKKNNYVQTELLKYLFFVYGKLYKLPSHSLSDKLRLICKITGKTNLKRFVHNFQNGAFTIELNKGEKRFTYYLLAFAHEYTWHTVKDTVHDYVGKNSRAQYYYEDFFEKKSTDTIFTGLKLKRNRIDNLKHYDVIEQMNNVLTSKYRLKKGENLYKLGYARHHKILKFTPLT